MSVDRIKTIGSWVLAIAAALLLYLLGLFSGVETVLEDVLYPAQPTDESIAIIAIDDDSLAEIGQWPWPRAVFAEFLEVVEVYDPQVVAVDVLFAEPSRIGESDDLRLSEQLNQVPYPVVLPVLGELTRTEEGWVAANLVGPLEQFSENVLLGHANLVIDRDGVVRNVPLTVTSTEGDKFESFGYLAAGESAEGDTARIAFAGPPETLPHYSFADVLRGREELPKNSRIFIGATTPSLHDEQQTPVSRGVAMSGVEIQAQITNMALGDLSLREISAPEQIAIIVISVLVPLLLFTFLARAQTALILSVLFGVVVTIAIILAFQYSIVVNVVHTTLAWLIGSYVGFTHKYRTVTREKRHLKQVMSKYVSRDVLREVLEKPEVLRLGGQDREVTIFFSDVRGFTSLSESMSPSGLVEFLNRYLTDMTDLILDHDGVVDKYIGDAIMAFWGAPLKNENHALSAVRTALDMIDSLNSFNRNVENEAHKDIDIGIGLNSGEVVVGNMGSEQRFDYTVMGDSVNLAARLEGQTKTYGIHILISEFTRKQISKEMEEGHDILIRELDRIQVKGKEEPVVVFQVVDRDKQEFVSSVLDTFNTARGAYYSGNWKECLAACDEILKKGDDGPTKLLKGRAEEFVKQPPENWEGVYRLTSK